MDATWIDATWIDATEERIEAAAVANGWSMICRSIASTGSRYYDLAREAREDGQTDQDVEDFGLAGLEEFTLRISDHGDCYCRAAMSVAKNPSGDDTTIEAVLRRLSAPQKV
jgi:hypothetical protein